MKQPNIVLITVDQMRGDCMGNAGHPVVETPYLDTMAKNGVSFTKAYSAVPSCIAARCALMTGMSQERHRRKGYKDNVVFDYPNTLAGGLADAGYHTQCVGKMHVYPTRSLLGFHNVVLHDGFLHAARSHSNTYAQQQSNIDDYFVWLKRQKGFDADVIDTGLEANSWVARPWIYEEQYHPTNWVVTESIDFLRRRDPGKPFFLMSSFVRPHSPLDPPEFYLNLYLNKEIDRPKQGDWNCPADGIPDYNDTQGTLEETQQNRQRAAYYGCITHIDHQIGRLLQAINDTGELQNTVFIFTSDHGDLLGDHHLFRKALPYEGSARVPLILYDPGDVLHLPKGSKVDKVAEMRDIMPTLLEIAGAEIPDTVDGKSLLGAVQGKSWRSALIGQHEFGAMSNHYIVSSHDKYLYFDRDGREQYFDLDRDPDETHNAVSDAAYRERVETLRAQLKQYMETESPSL